MASQIPELQNASGSPLTSELSTLVDNGSANVKASSGEVHYDELSDDRAPNTLSLETDSRMSHLLHVFYHYRDEAGGLGGGGMSQQPKPGRGIGSVWQIQLRTSDLLGCFCRICEMFIQIGFQCFNFLPGFLLLLPIACLKLLVYIVLICLL